MTRPRLKPLLMPAEHGAWGLVGAPVLLGLAVAPSWAGALLAVAAAGLFLARQPLKIAAKDLVQRKRYPRTSWALGFALALLALAFAAAAGGVRGSSAPLLPPIGGLLVLAAVQFGHDALGKGRSALPEIAGAFAASMFAPLIALAGGMAPRGAWLLGAVLAAHAVLAIEYVSNRLALARGEEVSSAPVWVLAPAALGSAAGAVLVGWAGWPLVASFALLAGRALWGVSPLRARVRPQTVGFQEIGYTLQLVLCAALAGIDR